MRIWFIVPAHGRVALTRVCLRQLKRTCDALAPEIEATAVVIADDANLDTAEELGFATIRRDNHGLGAKFNDGYQLACDPKYNPEPADYVVPCGSDDWIDPIIFQHLPERSIGIFRQMAIVNEDRTRLSRLKVGWKAGAGIRIIPHQFIARANYRPAQEDYQRGCDTATLEGLRKANGWGVPPTVLLDVHPLQIIDWKTKGAQLNTYKGLRLYGRGESEDPFGELAEVYPAEAISEMRQLA